MRNRIFSFGNIEVAELVPLLHFSYAIDFFIIGSFNESMMHKSYERLE
jgi:hypothetical protein